MGKTLLGCLIGGLVAGLAIATTWRLKAEANNWDMWAAFGSIAAASVAGAIAVSDGRRRAKEYRDRGQLVASACRHQVSWIASEVSQIVLLLESAARHDCAPQDFQKHADALAALKILGVADIEPLVALPNNCAHNLAAGLDHIELAKSILSVFASTANIHFTEDRKKFAAQAATAARAAYDMLKAAGAELQAASFRAFGQTS